MPNLSKITHKIIKLHPLAILAITQFANEILADEATNQALSHYAGLYGLNGKCQQKIADLLRQNKANINSDDYYRLTLAEDEQKALLELCTRAKQNPYQLQTMTLSGLLEVGTELEQNIFE